MEWVWVYEELMRVRRRGRRIIASAAQVVLLMKARRVPMWRLTI